MQQLYNIFSSKNITWSRTTEMLQWMGSGQNHPHVYQLYFSFFFSLVPHCKTIKVSPDKAIRT